jgi:hypothetical protein
VQEFERRLILAALGASGWRQRAAAQRLGVLPTTLNEKMKRLGIPTQAPDPRSEAWAPDGAEVPLREELRWSGRLSAGRTLEMAGITGTLRAETAAGDEVRVLAVKCGPPEQRARVVVKVLPTRRGVLLVAAETEDAAGEGAIVDAWVQAPVGVRLVVRLGGGRVESFGVPGRFELCAREQVSGGQPASAEAAFRWPSSLASNSPATASP